MVAKPRASLPFCVCLRFFLGLGLVWLFAGCTTVSYYTQAFRGQTDIWRQSRPIPLLLSQEDLPEDLRSKLELIFELREFARHELALPVDGQYLQYADLGRPYVVWNVYAAPPYSLEPCTWWYPLLGRLSYRGFFSEESARAFAAGLEQEGMDVFVAGIDAYSTLGWFDDPALNTFLSGPPYEIAEIIFHELAHHRVFAPGDTDFNEALATAVAEAGVLRWLAQTGRQAEQARYRLTLERRRQLTEILLKARSDLEQLYSALDPSVQGWKQQADDRKRQIVGRTQQRLKRLEESWNNGTLDEAWWKLPINNARLNTVATYYRDVPAFETLLRFHGGSFDSFFEGVEKIAALPISHRSRALQFWNQYGTPTAHPLFATDGPQE